MHTLKRLLVKAGGITLGLLLLAGCHSLPDVDVAPKTVPLSTKKIDAVMGTVEVPLAPHDLRQGYLPPETQALTPLWQASVANALTQAQTFTPTAGRVANIRVQIIQISAKQNNDLSITTTTVASYEVIDAASQELIWIRGISTSSTVSYQEAMIQNTRERTSINRSIQSNIAQFVQLLGQGRVEYKPIPASELRIVQ